MPRISRNNIQTPFLHVMVQGVNKEYIFYNNKYIDEYLKLIEKYKYDYQVTIISYCIMNNHAHFLMYIEDIKKFAKFMQKVNFMYATMYNKNENRCGVLFRNRYQAEPIYERKYLINCIKYIHENPVKAGIVSDASNYKYSSYNNYISNKGECKSPIMREMFGDNCNYKEIFGKAYDMRFMDNEKNIEELNHYINEAMCDFLDRNKVSIAEIFSNRRMLKELIHDLRENYNFRYVEISKILEIPIEKIEGLKIKKAGY